MSLTKVTVTGTYTDGDGSALTGTVTFAPNATLTDTTESQIVRPVPIAVTLDGSGHFSTQLYATDNANLSPSGWGWVITETLTGVPKRTWMFELPATGGLTQDISALAPVTSTGQLSPYVPLAGATMTGLLVLSADPAANKGAATKQYVDGVQTASLQKSSNLSDLANAATARTNLGLGTAATHPSTDFDSSGAAAAAAAASLPLAGGTLTGHVAPAVATLTFVGAGTTLVNAALGNVFALTLTASTTTLGNPANPVDGQAIRVRLTQDGTGSRTIAYGTAYDFGAAGAPTLSTGANKVDILRFEYVASLTKWCYMGSGLTF